MAPTAAVTHESCFACCFRFRGCPQARSNLWSPLSPGAGRKTERLVLLLSGGFLKECPRNFRSHRAPTQREGHRDHRNPETGAAAETERSRDQGQTPGGRKKREAGGPHQWESPCEMLPDHARQNPRGEAACAWRPWPRSLGASDPTTPSCCPATLTWKSTKKSRRRKPPSRLWPKPRPKPGPEPAPGGQPRQPGWQCPKSLKRWERGAPAWWWRRQQSRETRRGPPLEPWSGRWAAAAWERKSRPPWPPSWRPNDWRGRGFETRRGRRRTTLAAEGRAETASGRASLLLCRCPGEVGTASASLLFVTVGLAGA